MFTREFWKRALERAVKTAAQSVVLALGVGLAATGAAPQVNAWLVQWSTVAGFAVGGFVLSVATSLASVKVGPADDPSVV